MKKQLKNACEVRKKIDIRYFTFPFAIPSSKLFEPNKVINLGLLKTMLDKTKTFETKYDRETNPQQRFAAVTVLEPNRICFNIYEGGKVVAYHSLNNDAVWHFLDFFYFNYVTHCLEKK